MKKHDDMSQIHSLKPQFIFGLNIGSSYNCFFINDKQIVYLAAGVIVIHDIQDNIQKFVSMDEPEKTITTMAISNNKYVTLQSHFLSIQTFK